MAGVVGIRAVCFQRAIYYITIQNFRLGVGKKVVTFVQEGTLPYSWGKLTQYYL
jgi:hypothetical protein